MSPCQAYRDRSAESVLYFSLLGNEPGLHLVGFGRAELGVQSECLLPVVAGPLILVGAVVAFGEIAVRAGLLVSVAGFGRQPECGGHLDASGGGLAFSLQGLGQVEQR